MIFSNPFLRSEYEIVLSKEWATAFINDNHPGYAFYIRLWKACKRNGNKITLSKVKSSLRGELTSSHAYYKDFSPVDICLLNQLQLFLDSPMAYYNINSVDLFLYRLSNVFQAEVLVIKSNTKDCWFEDLTGNNTENQKKLYFIKTLPQHIDPAALKVNEENEDNSDDSLRIAHPSKGSEKCKVGIISLHNDNELANAFPGSTDKEPKSAQTNPQQNENPNETKLCIQSEFWVC